MRAVERVLRNQDERKRRLDAAKAAEAALTPDEREEFIAHVIAKFEDGEKPLVPPADLLDHDSPRRARKVRSTPGKRKRTVPPPKVAKGNKRDAAEAYILSSKEGVSTGDVALHIGQSMRTADSTLRQLAKARGTIIRRDGLWHPAESAEKKKTSRTPTNRRAIVSVLSASTALGTGEIFEGVRAVVPGAQYGSIAAEIMRMRRGGLIVITGQGAHGMLYGLANGGAGTATAN